MADGSKYLGARLQVTTAEGKYEGIVQSIDAEKRKLTLNKVVCCSTGRRLHGFHHFFGHELNHLELLEESNNNDQETKSKEIEGEDGTETNKHSAACNNNSHKDSKPRRSRSAHTKSSVAFPRGSSTGAIKAFTDAGIGFNSKLAVSRGSLARDVSDEGNSLLKRDPIVAEKYLSDTFYDEDDKENLSPDVLPDVVPIDAFGEAFEDAVKFISKQRVIGVCCEGVKLGRYGKLCWLVIGCSKAIYLFDIHTLGAPCFDEGLQDILESGDILKVFHDCRQASDALYHHYGITLMNVFDTQVADILVYRNERGGDLPRHVNGLVACLYEYLNLSPEHVHFQKVRQKYMQRSDSIWAERPAPSSLLEASAKHVLYLRELRLAQMERLMAEFLYGVDIYLSEIRDSKELNPKARGQLVPDKFKELGRFRYRQRTRRFDGDFVENAKDVVPKDVLASREAWSEGRHFAEAYANKKGRVKERKFEHPTAVERLRQVARDSGSDSEASNAGNTSSGVAHEAEPIRMGQSSFMSSPLPIPSHLPAVFSENDFPPLSSSESEGQGTPPRPPRANGNRKNRLEGAITKRNIVNADTQLNNETLEPQGPGFVARSAGEQVLLSQSPMGVSKGFPSVLGRGRASALLRHAAMPAVRLPTDNPDIVGDRRLFENVSEGNTFRESGHEFPSDDEILAYPEIISLPGDHFVGGTQVRIRKT